MKKPGLIMSMVLMPMVSKTKALGGVATGNMNANDTAMVVGIMSNNGFVPMLKA